MAQKCIAACFTGHRPMVGMSFCPGEPSNKKLQEVLEQEILRLTWMEDVRVFYTGMAMGFDIFAGEILLGLKSAGSLPADVRIIAVLPFVRQMDQWRNQDWIDRYMHLLHACTDRGVFSVHCYDGSYQMRNRYIVDHSQFVVAFFDGRKRSGTAMTVNYAKKMHKSIYNLFLDIV